MNFCPNILKSSLILRETHQAFTSNIPFLHGIFPCKSRFMASVVGQRPKSKHSQIAKPCFLISILRHSSVSRSSQIGKMVHGCIFKSAFGSDLLLANNLLRVYCSCLSVFEALKLFYEMSQRDVVSWNTMISGLIQSGFFEDGFSFYSEMKRAGFCPSQSSFASVLVASVEMASFENCRQIHAESLKCGFSSDILVGNALLTAYVKHGNIKESRKMFDGMYNFDEVSFEILLRGYIQQGISTHETFELFRYSFLVQVPLSHFTLSRLISLCTGVEAIDLGMQIHGYVIKAGLYSDVSIVNSLITMYARSYLLEDAVCLFDGASSHDIVTWNSLIAGYAFNSQGDVGMGLVASYLSAGMRMNDSTFSSFLSSCATVTILEIAKKAHVLILKLRESTDLGTDNIMLTMYCRCRSLSYANNVFNTVGERDAISFNLLIGLFRNYDCHEESIKLFCLIQLEGFQVDEQMYSSLISSCSRLINLEFGRQIHCCVIKTGFEMIAPLGNSLLEMYSQCGSFNNMHKLFGEIGVPDIFTWNTMVMGYAHYGLFDQSIRILWEMKESSVELNAFSYCAMIDICSYIEAPLIGEQIQARVKKLGLGSDTALMNSLLTMYASCGMMEQASKIFEEIPSNDSVSWNAMICGYVQNGFTEESLKCYLMMNWSGFKPNNMTFASISKSCAEYSELFLGLQFHTEVIKRGFESDVTVSNSFITFYAKCGDIYDSSKIFRNTVTRGDVITWNSMICAYSHHGYGREALDTVSEMKAWGEKPNAITFVGILSACGRAGLVSEAHDQFNSMYRDHGIVPSEEHYACMVDILCRAGRLRVAKELIESMPYDPCPMIWRTLLSACRLNDNLELGEEAAEKLIQLEPHDSSAYVLLSNIYASVEKMEKKAEMRRRMGDRKVKKEIGYSWILS